MPRQQIDLRIINTDGGTQPRQELDKAVIADFAAAYTRGDKLPPIVVFQDEKQRYWLADGFHRHWAMLYECDWNKKVSCEVIEGTVEDAQWYACAANQAHGLRRSTEDKRCAVEMALRNPHAVGLSDLQIAKHIGVDDKTVAKRRREMVGRSEIPNVSTRTDSAGRQQPATKPTKVKAASPERPTDSQIAAMVGTTVDMMDHARVVLERGIPEVVGDVEKGKLHIDVALRIASLPQDQQLAALAEEVKPSKSKKAPSDGMAIAYKAVALLEQIAPNDKQRNRAFEFVYEACRRGMCNLSLKASPARCTIDVGVFDPTQPETSPVTDLVVAVAPPVTIPATPSWSCPNCRHDQHDDDGDCLKCREPAACSERNA